MGFRKTVSIGDLGKIVGGATPSTKIQENWDGDIPWLCPKDLANYNQRYISRGERNITQQGYESCSTKVLPTGTVLFSSRAPIGYIAIAKNPVCTNQGFKSIIPNDEIDSLFLYYLLKANKNRIESSGSGTTFKELSGKTFGAIEVSIPASKDEQAAIAHILGSLDNKIELNNQINDYLAEFADSYFKEAFNSLETNAQLSDIAQVTMGQSPAGASYNEEDKGAVLYQGRGDFGWRYPTRRLFTTEPKRMASKNDVLMSVRAPVGDLNIAFEDCCIGRGLAAIHSDYQSYVLYLMRSLKSQLDAYNGEGTVFGSINGKSLKTFPIALPTITAIDDFQNFIKPIDDVIRCNEQEKRDLEELRDLLLPKLMSGEIDVSQIDLTQLNNHLSDC